MLPSFMTAVRLACSSTGRPQIRGLEKSSVDGIYEAVTGDVTLANVYPKNRLTIGRSSLPVDSGNFFNGIIDEVRISSIARYTEDFHA